MAGTFTATGTLTNLTRLEQEQLRRVDFYSNLKALTVGDPALGSENIVGQGSLLAEPYVTGPLNLFEDLPSITPPTSPGLVLGTVAGLVGLVSETVRWYGPDLIMVGNQGYGDTATFYDYTVDFAAMGVLAGDLLIISSRSTLENEIAGSNDGAVAVVQTVGTSTLGCTSIRLPGGASTFAPDYNVCTYLIVRPNAVQLFAVPGSGPVGQEQSFLAVAPTTALHDLLGPTKSQIATDRVTFLVPGHLSGDPTVDRADAIYSSPAPTRAADKLGYRIILYPSNGTGTGPDLVHPIAALNPVINSSLPIDDQRMEVDYTAGVIRFSCPPAIGGDIKVSGGVNATTGRLNLYATFWAFDRSLTAGSARSLWSHRTTAGRARAPAKVAYAETTALHNHWEIGSTSSGNPFYIYAPDRNEDWREPTLFGAYDSTGSVFRHIGMRKVGPNARRLRMLDPVSYDPSYPYHQVDTGIEAKSQLQLGAAGTHYTGDYNAPAGEVDSILSSILSDALQGALPRVKLGRGIYNHNQAILNRKYYLPPGLNLEGDGEATKLLFTGGSSVYPGPLLTVGPNTPWNVYDPTSTGSSISPLNLLLALGSKVEGYDVVWNPIRRVWGVAIADLGSNSIWFNEVKPDGTSMFPGVGVDIKGSTTPLYSNSHAYSSCHTPGHYPRLAYSEGTRRYHIVWVDEYAGATTGPRVKYQSFQVSDSTNEPSVTNIVGTEPQLSLNLIASISVGTDFSDHPSIAVGHVSAINDRVAISYTSYATQAATALPAPYDRVPSGAVCARAIATVGSSVPSWTYGTTATVGSQSFTGTEVISSTDVAWDGADGFLYTYSVRRHPLAITTGYRGDDGSLYSAELPLDPLGTIPTWISILPFAQEGSKLLMLGNATTLDPNVEIDDAYNGIIEAWGDDAIVLAVTDHDLPFRWQRTGRSYTAGFPFPINLTIFFDQTLPSSPQGLVNSPPGANPCLIDSSHNFSTEGVKCGDWISVSSSVNGYPFIEYKRVIAIGTSTNPNDTLRVGSNWATIATAIRYNIHPGTGNFALVPQSYVIGVRYTGSGVTGPFTYAGEPFSATATYVTEAQHEPDFVRVCKGRDTFLVTWQCFETTARLATVLTTDLQDDVTSASTNYIAINDCNAPYRVHQGTFAVLVDQYGNAHQPNQKTLQTLRSDFDESNDRNTHLTAISLGTHNPLSRRPNYMRPNAGRIRPHHDWAVNLHGFSHRWDGSNPPSLIPDATWNGSDYVVVSPSKASRRSYTGVYEVNGSGVVTLKDITVYMSDGYGSPTWDPLVPSRTTTPPGTNIYFPAINDYSGISIYRSAHSIQLSINDSGLFNYGNNTSTRRIEWVLNNSLTTTHGLKNPGYRINEQGEVLVSSSYNTFADEVPEGDTTASVTMATNRGSVSDHFITVPTSGRGFLNPGTSDFNGRDHMVDYRYRADIGFQGVAVGIPRGGAYNHRDESPFVAIAWGENLFGFLDRRDVSGTNGVSFFRQSFGPYNVTLKDLTISYPYNGTPSVEKTLQRVHTRWGGPVGPTGTLETNGYQNVFLFPGQTNRPTTSWYKKFVQAVFTDIKGRWPIEVGVWQSPAVATVSSGYNTGFQGEQHTNNTGATSCMPTAPSVVWDGERFVTAWVQTVNYQQFYLNLAVVPDEENLHLLGPTDGRIWRPIASTVLLGPGTSSNRSFLTTALATSGNTYAVAWVMGLASEVGGTDYNSAVYGVTIFDKAEMGGGFLATDKPYLKASFTASGTLLSRDPDLVVAGSWSTSNLTAYGVLAGDIVSIGDPYSYGLYQVQDVTATTVTLDRSVPVGSGSVYASFSRPSTPATGRTYILSNIALPDNDREYSATKPHITWGDGHYQIVWAAKPAAAPDDVGTDNYLWTVSVPEYGYGQGTQQKAVSNDVYPSSPHAVGMINKSESTGSQLYFVEQPGHASLTGDLDGAQTITLLVDPASEGIMEGDLVSYPSSVTYPIGPWQVTAVSRGGTTVTVEGTLPTATGVTLLFYRTHMPPVQVGDHFHVTEYVVGSTRTVLPGVLTIDEVDVQRRRVSVSWRFLDLSGLTSNSEVFLNGILVNSNTAQNNGSSPSPRPILLPPMAELGVNTFEPDVTLGIVYNPNRDEYATLTRNVSVANNEMSLSTWKRSGYMINRITRLGESSSYHFLHGNLAFNGEHYCVVGLEKTDSLVVAYILNQDLRPIATVNLTTTSGDLIGNVDGKTPGPGYNYPGTGGVGTNFVPTLRRVQVKWNPKLGRWVAAVTVSWQTPAPASGMPVYPDVYNLSLTATSMTGGNVLNFATDASNYVAQYFLPGLKVTAYTGVSTYLQTLTIVDRVGGTSNASVTFGERIISSATDYDAWDIHPREDVFCFTFGVSDPVVRLVDADGVLFEGVQFDSPGAVEEVWTHAGKPIWQSSGSVVGASPDYSAPTAVQHTDTAAVTHAQVFSQRLLKPRKDAVIYRNVRGGKKGGK